jgi:hypothetical protein
MSSSRPSIFPFSLLARADSVEFSLRFLLGRPTPSHSKTRRKQVFLSVQIHIIVQQLTNCHGCKARSHGAWIPRSVFLQALSHFKFDAFFAFISFQSNSRLKRIESYAFSSSLLESIVIIRSGESLCSSCFFSCRSLSSISFESHSGSKRIESSAF